jgi:hypothetical protein
VRAAAASQARRRGRQAWPALAAAAVVLLALGTVLIRPAPNPLRDPEIARARIEARYALAVVADAWRRAGTLTRREVVLKRIVAPSAGALHRVLPGRLDAGGVVMRPSTANGG